MADTFLEQKELMPKDILRFVETRAERALEVLREIIDIPEYSGDAVLAQAVAPNQIWTTGLGTGTNWGSAGTIVGTPLSALANVNVQAQAQAQGGFNG